jgi:hypothetical protein
MVVELITSAPSGLSFCPSCLRLRECNFDDWVRFARNHWPECCGKVMPFYRLNDKPTSEDLETEQEVFFG